MSILLTGGSGLLGSELRKLRGYLAPSYKEMDITNPKAIEYYLSSQQTVSLVVHCAAFKNQDAAELQKQICYDTNVIGTLNLVRLKLPMLFISSDSVFNGEKGMYEEDDFVDPLNYYCLTKALAEQSVRTLDKHVIVRCSFRSRPFEHAKACTDKYVSADYVNVIAKHIDDIIQNFHAYPNGIYHIGTKRTSLYDLATQTRKVKPILLKDLKLKLPKDVSLNLTKWKRNSNR